MASEPTGSAGAKSARLQFDRYVLDFDRGSLLLDGREIALRSAGFPSSP